MKAFIGADKKEIALSDLVEVPRFLRFGNVILEYPICSQSIAESESFRGLLSTIKTSLYDSNSTWVCTENASQFIDHSSLLEHIHQILSICDSSRGYSFVFRCYSDAYFGNVIASILEMPEIIRSSTVYIFTTTIPQLPVETISNWLNRERHEMEQKQRHRRLELLCYFISDDQIQEMFAFLKQVSFNFRIFSLKLHSIS